MNCFKWKFIECNESEACRLCAPPKKSKPPSKLNHHAWASKSSLIPSIVTLLSFCSHGLMDANLQMSNDTSRCSPAASPSPIFRSSYPLLWPRAFRQNCWGVPLRCGTLDLYLSAEKKDRWNDGSRKTRLFHAEEFDGSGKLTVKLAAAGKAAFQSCRPDVKVLFSCGVFISKDFLQELSQQLSC